MAKDEAPAKVEVGGREVTVTHPSKVYFPAARLTKLDLVCYYLAVAEGALRGVRDRPLVLVRYIDGVEGQGFYQKRAPTSRPDWLRTVALRFPSGRTAEELVVDEPAALAWMANLGCIELHPHPVRADDLDHPDELRVDLDPGPGVPWEHVQRVALVVREVLEEHGLQSWPKTSGSRGMHILVRIERRWGFTDVRRAALALAREVERRVPTLATSKWWKEERHGVFLDYNQNAKDRTTCAAYSVRPRPDARVSAPLAWDEVDRVDPADFTLKTMPARFVAVGDRHAGIDEAAGSLGPLLALSVKDEASGLGDAPWPPHHDKKEGEAPRVAPSRARGARAAGAGSAAKKGTGRRQPKDPLIVVARAKKVADAEAGLARWKQRHPEAAAHLAPDDVLIDKNRGRSSVWTQIRINLRHVPEGERPPPDERPDPDEEDPGGFGSWRR